MSNDAPPKEKHKVRMVEAAVVVLEREGLAALQARRIAKDCGCSVGTIYNTFEGLDDLIVQANSITLARLHGCLVASTEALSASETFERLMALAKSYLDFCVQNEKSWRAVFEHRPQEHWLAPAWYREQQSEIFDTVANVLVQVVIDETARERLARALFAAVHGIVTLSMDHGADREEIESRIRLVISATADFVHHMGGSAADM